MIVVQACSNSIFCFGVLMASKGDFRAKFVELIKEAGWEFAGHKKHDKFKRPGIPHSLTVPSKLGDRALANKLLKIALVDARL